MALDLQNLLEEQKQYYRARAAEYDQWFYRENRYDYGPEHTQQWQAEVQVVRRHLLNVNLTGQVLEFAAGTGIWTQELLKTAEHVTALDSSPEVLEINQFKVQSDRVSYEVADNFSWQPRMAYDAVFMSFWLSHVPPTRLADFLATVRAVLKPGGKIFLIDSLPVPTSTTKDMAADLIKHAAARTQTSDEDARMKRRLNDGREFDIIKVYYVPAELSAEFKAHDMVVNVQPTENFFLYGSGTLG